jgi:hypothetical protein
VTSYPLTASRMADANPPKPLPMTTARTVRRYGHRTAL